MPLDQFEYIVELLGLGEWSIKVEGLWIAVTAPPGVDGGAGERLLVQRANLVEGHYRLLGPKAEAGVFPLKSNCRPAVSTGPPLHGA